VNALLIALITAVWIICVFGCLPLPLDLPSLGSSFLLLTAQLALGCSWTNLKTVKDVKARLLMHYLTLTFATTAWSCKK
jgi:hypothetical protein